ncbi:MAG: SAF domain-containing protein [Bacilli bacterium]
MKRSGIFTALSLVAAVAAGLLTTVILTAMSHTETIVVTTQYVPPYTPITAQEVKTVTVPDSIGMANLATQLHQVVGNYVTFPIPKGYPITAADMSVSTTYAQFLTAYVNKTHTPGMLVSLVSSSPLATMVQPGDKIALVVPGGGGSGFQTIAPITVLGVVKNGNGAPTLLLFVQQSDYQSVMQGILAGNADVELIPQNGAFRTANAATAIGNPLITKSTSPTVAKRGAKG